ncbi:MAG: FAD-dependent oxidoreductase [Sphingomonas sp.]
MSARDDAIVLGAGVVGVSTAYALARRGVAVTIVDRAVGPGQGASFANGGQLSYAYADPLASPGLLRRLPALAIGADPAFRLRWRADPELLRWLLAFLRNCTAERFRANMLAMLRLTLESKLALHALLERHSLAFAHRVAGKLHMFDGEAAFAQARALMAVKEAAGVQQRALTPSEAIAIEPALELARDGIAGAIYSPDDEVGDPHLFCRALIEVLVRDYGVRTQFGAAAARIEPAGGRPRLTMADGHVHSADTIVLCAGIGAGALLRPLGIRPSIVPMKGYSITAEPGRLAPRVSITDVARKLVFCRLGRHMRVAGLAELGDGDPRTVRKRCNALVASARAALPQAVDWNHAIENWAGLRPMTPNSLPIIEAAGPGLVVNIGHGALGWTAAMGSGERAAQLALAARE